MKKYILNEFLYPGFKWFLIDMSLSDEGRFSLVLDKDNVNYKSHKHAINYLLKQDLIYFRKNVIIRDGQCFQTACEEYEEEQREFLQDNIIKLSSRDLINLAKDGATWPIDLGLIVELELCEKTKRWFDITDGKLVVKRTSEERKQLSPFHVFMNIKILPLHYKKDEIKVVYWSDEEDGWVAY